MGHLGGRALSKYEQITCGERDRLAKLLAKHYREGATIRDLAGQTGRSFGWVRDLLLEAGVELRSRGGDMGQQRARREITAEDVIALRKAGWSIQRIANHLGCSWPTVKSRLVRAGME